MEDIDAPPTPKSDISFITPLLISTIGILATTLAIVTYHLIVLRYCIRRHRNNITSFGNMETGTLDERLNTGVDEKVLAKIPITIHRDAPGADHSCDDECAVCLGELEDGDPVRILPGCKHAFHVPCIDRWLFSHTTCPVCRSVVAAPADEVVVAVGPARVEEDRDVGSSASSTSRLQLQPFPLLRHCVSFVLPKERRLQCCSPGRIRLKRSLSWDQTFVFFDIQRDCPSSNYNSSLRRSRSLRIQSVRQLHRVSSKFLRSFSRLHVAQRTGILPL